MRIMSIPIRRSMFLTRLHTITFTSLTITILGSPIEMFTTSAILVLFIPLTLTRSKGIRCRFSDTNGVMADLIAPVSHKAVTLNPLLLISNVLKIYASLVSRVVR